jgi:hypothetical protein
MLFEKGGLMSATTSRPPAFSLFTAATTAATFPSSTRFSSFAALS